MSVSAISNDRTAIAEILRQAEASMQTSTPPTLDATATVSSTDSADFSEPAEFYSQLQQLQSTDPATAKEVMSEIASKLREKAKDLSGKQAEMMNGLADKFEQAAKTGDISLVKPPSPPPGADTGNALATYEKYSQDTSSSLVDYLKSATSGGSDTSLVELLSSLASTSSL